MASTWQWLDHALNENSCTSNIPRYYHHGWDQITEDTNQWPADQRSGNPVSRNRLLLRNIFIAMSCKWPLLLLLFIQIGSDRAKIRRVIHSRNTVHRLLEKSLVEYIAHNNNEKILGAIMSAVSPSHRITCPIETNALHTATSWRL